MWEEGYPKRLKEISDPPLVLYRIGKLPEPGKKMAAIVGARACSSYGKEMAEYFARGLAKEGIGIVSGMARGADGIAQRAALSAGGYSVAVLGCGVDICYPEENRPLYEKAVGKRMYPVGISVGDAAAFATVSAAQPDHQCTFGSRARYRSA